MYGVQHVHIGAFMLLVGHVFRLSVAAGGGDNGLTQYEQQVNRRRVHARAHICLVHCRRTQPLAVGDGARTTTRLHGRSVAVVRTNDQLGARAHAHTVHTCSNGTIIWRQRPPTGPPRAHTITVGHNVFTITGYTQITNGWTNYVRARI
jgi:hypothetical protein